MDLEEFIAKVSQKPLPNNPMARIRTLAKELAEGVVIGLWNTKIYFVSTPPDEYGGSNINYDEFSSAELTNYLSQRWDNNQPKLQLLKTLDYIDWLTGGFEITKSAFSLLEEIEPSTIFISYKRSESSPFALLVLGRLKEKGLEAFLDMSMRPGDDWHAHIKEQIESHDFMVLLLGKETLSSDIVLKEIGWAMEAGLTIIPIWHNGFEYKSGTWPNIPVKIDKLLSTTHTIRVVVESASDYEKAIIELLNRFGITP